MQLYLQIAGFPNVIGALDGTYIPLRTPVKKIKSTYVNRHDITALTMQGICDSRKRFLDVFTGVSGKIHDSRVFSLSHISNNIAEICDNDTYHLLADSAYPINTFLLTPFKNYGNLTAEQQNYNYRLSRTRVVIENAFGILKQRFRQLIRTDFWLVHTTAKFIIATCVLHNLCINQEDYWEIDIAENNNLHRNYDNAYDFGHRAERVLGENKRNYICQQLANN